MLSLDNLERENAKHRAGVAEEARTMDMLDTSQHKDMLGRYKMQPPPPAPAYPAAPDSVEAPELDNVDADSLTASPFNENGNFVGESPDDRDTKLHLERNVDGYQPDHVFDREADMPDVVKRMAARTQDGKWAQVQLPLSERDIDVMHQPTEKDRLASFDFMNRSAVEVENERMRNETSMTPPPPTPAPPFQATFWDTASLDKLNLHKTQAEKLMPDGSITRHMIGPAIRCTRDLSQPIHLQGAIMQWCANPQHAQVCERAAYAFSHLRGAGVLGPKDPSRGAFGMPCTLLTRDCVKKGQKVGGRYMTQMDMMHFPKAPEWGRCAVVGNSAQLINSHRGPEISAHDTIIRVGYTFNGHPSAPPVKGRERHVGNRTDVTILLPGYNFQSKRGKKRDFAHLTNGHTKYWIKWGYQPNYGYHTAGHQTLWVSPAGAKKMREFDTLVMQTWSQVSAGLSTSFGMGGKVLEEMKKRKGWQVAPEVKAAALMQLSTQCRSVDLYGLPHAARLSQTPYANQQGVEPTLHFDASAKHAAGFYWSGAGLDHNGGLIGYEVPTVTLSTIMMNSAMMAGHVCVYQDGEAAVTKNPVPHPKKRGRRLLR